MGTRYIISSIMAGKKFLAPIDLSVPRRENFQRRDFRDREIQPCLVSISFLKLHGHDMHEKSIRDVHGTEFFALSAVYARICNKGIPQHMEGKGRWDNSRGIYSKVLWICHLKGRADFNAGVALNATGSLIHHLLQAIFSLP